MNSRELLEIYLDQATDLARIEISRALVAPHMNLINIIRNRSEDLSELDEIVAEYTTSAALNPLFGRF